MKKHLKFLLGVFSLFALFTIASANKASAQTTKYYTYTGTTFTIGSSSSGLLNTIGNWSGESSTAPDCPFPNNKLCAIKVVITAGSPSQQDIIDRVKARYDANPSSFTNGNTFTEGNGTTLIYTIEISLKS